MTTVEGHYGRENLTEVILAALRQAGLDIERLQAADLAPVDEFHTRGLAATRELGALLSPVAGDRVIDLGCGIGGPARYLASTFGCHVTGIDLTPAYVETATALTKAVGLDDRCAFRVGDATALPFPDASFDHAWTQHVAMNIADKAALYHEAFRVLRPGGRFMIYDVLQGPGGAIAFPVPWAGEPAISHLVTPDELEALVSEAGFTILHRHDRTATCVAWAKAQAERTKVDGPSPLSLAVIMGPAAPERFANHGRNLAECRVLAYELLARKPA